MKYGIYLLALLLTVFVAGDARAELCLAKIDNSIAKRSGYHWQWRMVEGDPRKCWFYSNTLLPKEDLIWSYQSHEFDEDVTVLGRKFYMPDPDENGLLIERK